MIKWKLSETGIALVLSSGTIWIGKKKPRGLLLEDVITLLDKNPNKGYYTHKQPRTITMVEAIYMDKFKSAGKVVNTTTAIDLYLLDPDRKFQELPKTGRQLLNKIYESEPIYIMRKP